MRRALSMVLRTALCLFVLIQLPDEQELYSQIFGGPAAPAGLGDWGGITASEGSVLFTGTLQLNKTRYSELLKAAEDSMGEAKADQKRIAQYQLLSAQSERLKAQIDKDEMKPAQEALEKASEALAAASPEKRPAAESLVQQATNQIHAVKEKLVRIDQEIAQRAAESAKEDWMHAKSRLDATTDEGRAALTIQVERFAKALAKAESRVAETKSKDYRLTPSPSIKEADEKLKQIDGYLQKANEKLKAAQKQLSDAGKQPPVAGELQFLAFIGPDHNSVILDKTPERADQNFIMLNQERLQITEKQLVLLGIASDDYITVKKGRQDWGRLWMGRHHISADGTIEVRGSLDNGLTNDPDRFYITWTATAKR